MPALSSPANDTPIKINFSYKLTHNDPAEDISFKNEFTVHCSSYTGIAEELQERIQGAFTRCENVKEENGGAQNFQESLQIVITDQRPQNSSSQTFTTVDECLHFIATNAALEEYQNVYRPRYGM